MAEGCGLIDKYYLKEHYLEVYWEDAIAQMLSTRQEGNKSPTMKPCKFFKEYFTSVHQGTHILFREFSFICATPYNRLCVLKAILQIFKPIFYGEDWRNARDYHSILQLVWQDFGEQDVQDAFTAYDDDKKDEENRMKFLDFVKAMKASFCTGELNFEAEIIHRQIEARIEEFSNVPTTNIPGEASRNLCEADFLVNVEGKPWTCTAKILDGSEFKRLLEISGSKSNSVSSDEPVSGGNLTRSSSESKEVSKSEKTGKKKTGTKGGTKGKTRGRLAGKHLSNSLNVLQSGKGDEQKKGKRRNRSKSAVDNRKPWRP